MAQQLASFRTAASYSGVASYALTHPGIPAATAYLALGHAYTLDRRYAEAADAFHRAATLGDALSDYADYLCAQALVNANRSAEVAPLLDHFAERHPESIFGISAPLLLANSYTQQKNGPAAVKVLEPMLATPEADHADFKLALARAYQAAGDNTKAAALLKSIFVAQPLSFEATQALSQLQAMGQTPTAAERKLRADAIFNAKHYAEASAEYHAIRNDSTLTQADRDGLEIYSAGCDLKLKHLSRRDAEKLPATNDDTAALKLYLLAEISRTEKDRVQHDALIAQMVEKYPRSRWLEEALYSGGNMYLLTHDTEQSLYHYRLLVERFPLSIYAPSAHWRVAWMSYRQRKYADAARLMDEQIVRYGAGTEASSALYWRARILEDQDHDFPQAVNYYKALTANYTNFYYGCLAKQRLAVLGTQTPAPPAPALASVRKLIVPDLVGAVPQDDPHYIKAKLLANAALNEYIAPEIAASPGSAQWGALAQAEIYASYGEITRALQSMKHSGISFFAIPASQVPTEYWKLMFPQPYWGDLVADLPAQRSRPLSRRLAHPPGVRVQPRRRQPRPCLRTHAAAPLRRQGERQERRDEGLPARLSPQPLRQPRPRHPQPTPGPRPLRRPTRVRPRRLQRRRRPRPSVDVQRRVQGHRRVRRIHPLHRDPRVRTSHPPQPRDVPRPLRPQIAQLAGGSPQLWVPHSSRLGDEWVAGVNMDTSPEW